jgi:ketosteroid isomerase-like protein
MAIKLPEIIKKYVDASNEHDVKSILSCFSDDAFVRDEGKELRGKQDIENWIVTTIEKYKFHFEPVGIKEDGAEIVVALEVSGTLDGSPVTPTITSRSRGRGIKSYLS